MLVGSEQLRYRAYWADFNRCRNQEWCCFGRSNELITKYNIGVVIRSFFDVSCVNVETGGMANWEI